MESLSFLDHTEFTLSKMVVSFAGWPDAGQAATDAVKYVTKQYTATKLAEIDPEEFFDFTVIRPVVRIDGDGGRIMEWPTNTFFSAPFPDQRDGLLLFIGTEPNLRWRTFADKMMKVAQRVGVDTVFTLGALNDAVPHTRTPAVTGIGNNQHVRDRLNQFGISGSSYEGPTGIHSAFMDACSTVEMPVYNLWGHNPHYLTSSSNPTVSLALLSKLQEITGLKLDVADLKNSCQEFNSVITKVVDQRPEIVSYIKKLEQQYDSNVSGKHYVPAPTELLEELEDFLRSQRDQA